MLQERSGTHIDDVPAARLDAAAELLTAVVPPSCAGLTPYDSERFAGFLSAGAGVPERWRTLVVRGYEHDDALVAAADWRLLGSTLFLNGIAVAPGARGQGIARALLDDGLALARAHRCRWIELDVAADNAAGNRLYERYGFERAGASVWVEVAYGAHDPHAPDDPPRCRVRNWPAFDSHYARYGFGDLELTGPVGDLTVRVLPGGWRVPRVSSA